MQKMDKSELVLRLNTKLQEIQKLVREVEERKRRIKIEIENMIDGHELLKRDLCVEEGPLMKKILEKLEYRCMALNTSNTANNDVTGSKLGGIRKVALSEGSNIYVNDIENGITNLVFRGEEEGKNVEGPQGHVSFITCLHFNINFVYSGSMDKSIMCWDVDKGERVFVAAGHDGTVTCIHVDSWKMVSGSADTNVIVWEKYTGVMLRRILGHHCGVRCIQSGAVWCVSGSTDGDIYVWNNSPHDEDPNYKTVRHIG